MAGLVPSPRRVSLGAAPVERRVAPSAGWAYLDYPGGHILMRAETSVEQLWRVQACRKEPWTAAWLDTIGPGDRLFNIGACVGSYALIAAYRGAEVIAVEASPINAARLAENVAENDLGERVTLIVAACGPSEQPQGAYWGNYVVGAANIVIKQPEARGIILPGVTLDGLADTYGQATHLLIDVDGGELDVLRGGSESLCYVRDVMLEVSTEPRIAEGCAKILTEAGLPEIERWDHRDGVKIQGVTYSLHRRAT